MDYHLVLMRFLATGAAWYGNVHELPLGIGATEAEQSALVCQLVAPTARKKMINSENCVRSGA